MCALAGVLALGFASNFVRVTAEVAEKTVLTSRSNINGVSLLLPFNTLS